MIFHETRGRFLILLMLILVLFSGSEVRSGDSHRGFGAIGSPEDQAPPNVILIIGDGMDDHQITIARNYLVGVNGRLSLDHMPVRGVAQVLTVDEEDPLRVLQVADSANSATSMATGVVTSRGRIATTAGQDRDARTVIELAEEAGLRTGLVATSSVTDATPAAFVAHVSKRFCESPSFMVDNEISGFKLEGCPDDLIASGGLGSISEQIAASDVDVVLGGGSMHFDALNESGRQTVREQAEANGFHVMDTTDELRNAPPDKKLLGLFAESTLPVRRRGEEDREAEKPKPSLLNRIHWYLGHVEWPEPMVCEPNPDFEGIPTLKQMTDAALKHLSHDNDQGFFLMVESASIDKQAHSRNACGSLGELEQLNEALDSAMAFAEVHPNTLILVTADHGHAAQLVPDKSLYEPTGIAVYTPGHLVRLRGADNSIVAVNYATNDFFSEEHTGVQVPVLANREGERKVPAMLTQAELFTVMIEHLGLDGDHAAKDVN